MKHSDLFPEKIIKRERTTKPTNKQTESDTTVRFYKRKPSVISQRPQVSLFLPQCQLSLGHLWEEAALIVAEWTESSPLIASILRRSSSSSWRRAWSTCNVSCIISNASCWRFVSSAVFSWFSWSSASKRSLSVRIALESLGVAGASLSVFLLGVSLSGVAISCGRLRSPDTSLGWAFMLSSGGDVVHGVDGAAGRDSTICEASIIGFAGFAGGGGVIDGRPVGADTAVSGTAVLPWDPEIAIGRKNVVAGWGSVLVPALSSSTDVCAGTGELSLICDIKAVLNALLRLSTCWLFRPSHSPVVGLDLFDAGGGGGGGGLKLDAALEVPWVWCSWAVRGYPGRLWTGGSVSGDVTLNLRRQVELDRWDSSSLLLGKFSTSAAISSRMLAGTVPNPSCFKYSKVERDLQRPPSVKGIPWSAASWLVDTASVKRQYLGMPDFMDPPPMIAHRTNICFFSAVKTRAACSWTRT